MNYEFFDAISRLEMLELSYDGYVRCVEPHAYGRSDTGHDPLMLAGQRRQRCERLCWLEVIEQTRRERWQSATLFMAKGVDLPARFISTYCNACLTAGRRIDPAPLATGENPAPFRAYECSNKLAAQSTITRPAIRQSQAP